MRELDLIIGLFNQTFLLEYPFGKSATHRAWHGASLMRALEGVNIEQAKARPIKGRHTIWEIINHCNYWMKEVDRALQGEDIFNVENMEDWPIPNGFDDDWQTDLDSLKKTFEIVNTRIKQLSEEDLEKKLDAIWGETYFDFTFRKMLHGISDHNVYHAGQISLLKSNLDLTA